MLKRLRRWFRVFQLESQLEEELEYRRSLNAHLKALPQCVKDSDIEIDRLRDAIHQTKHHC